VEHDALFDQLPTRGSRAPEGTKRALFSPAAEGTAAPLEPFNDPSGIASAGRTLAGKLAALRPDVLVVWDGPDDSVLAHVVAFELGLRWVRAYDEGGFVGHVGDLMPGARAIVMADAFDDNQRIRALQALVVQHGAFVIGAAALVRTEALSRAATLVGTIVTADQVDG
jgi:hypothetical protein